MKVMQFARRFALTLCVCLVACQESAPDEPRPGSGGAAGTASPAGKAGGPSGGAAAGAQQGGSSGGVGAGGAAAIAGAGGSVNGAGSHQGGAAGAAIGGGGVAPTGGMAGAGGGAGTGAWGFPAGITKPRIMIVGDSISAGPGCYKKQLLKELTDHGYKSFEFVGEYTDDCGGGVRHSAVSCSTSEQYTQASFMVSSCQPGKSFAGLAPLAIKHKPDLIMLQLGVNDVWGGTPTATILARYKTLVEQARAQNPKVALVVAQIQKIRPDCGSNDSVQKRAEELIMAVPAWAKQLGTAQSPVFVADLWTNSDWSKAETTDCVHPNDIGAQKMGTNWFNALKLILPPG